MAKAQILMVPNKLSIKTANSFLKTMKEMKSIILSSDELIFDFRNTKYISPTGAVLLMCIVDSLNENGVRSSARTGRSGLLYNLLSTLGLLNVSENIDEVFQKIMAKYTVQLERCMSYEDCLKVQKKIMANLSETTDCVATTKASIDYMLDEIYENAGTHGYMKYEKSTSYPLPVYMCAQSYKTHFEVSIYDRGQGIHNSLMQNKDNLGFNAKESIEASIEKAITGHPRKSPGFGLYSAAQFVRGNIGGELHIMSSGRFLSVDADGILNQKGYLVAGTMVTAKFNLLSETPFSETLEGDFSLENQLDLITDLINNYE